MKLIALCVVLCCITCVKMHQHTFTGPNNTKITHKCIHDETIQSEEKLGRRVRSVNIESRKRKTGDIIWAPLRIAFRTDYVMNDEYQRTCYTHGQIYKTGNPTTHQQCSDTVTDDCWGTCSDTVMTRAKSIKLESLLAQVKAIFSQMLSTRQLSGSIKLDGRCGAFGGVQFPTDIQTDGFNGQHGDIVIFITTRPNPTGVMGWAIACVQESDFGRSIAAQFNIDPGTFFSVSTTEQIGIMVHEISHALGFSASRFKSFIDENGKRRQGAISASYRTFHDSNGELTYRQIFSLQTPGLIKLAKEYFGCDKLPYGIELEEYTGGLSSHFEKRIFQNEIMTANTGWFNPSSSYSISPFLLTYFEDTGWYRANMNFSHPTSETFLYGKNFGCSILAERCEDWDPKHRQGYSCKQANSQCTFNHKGKGFCEVKQYMQSLGYYEHLKQSKVGGTDAQNDYCPIIKRLGNGDCTKEQISGIPGEKYGENSGCFESNLLPLGMPLQETDSRCFEYRCERNILRVNAAGNWIDCPESEDYTRVTTGISGYGGYVACPQDGFTILCKSRNVIVDTVQDNPRDCSNLFGWCSSAHTWRTNMLMVVAILMFVFY